MPELSVAEIRDAVESARSGFHPHRAMRVTLECGHLRLMPQINCIMGIGAKTSCFVCPDEEPGYKVARTVVNVEETGVLHDDWHKFNRSANGRSDT